MSDIRDLFRSTLQDSNKEVVVEGKKKKKNKATIKAPHDRTGNEHLPPPTKTEEPAPIKAKNRKGKAQQKAKQDLKNYDESISEDQASDMLLEDLFDDMDLSEGFEFNEQSVNLLKKACMAGFMASTNESNGKNCKAIYKNSALQTGAEVWNKNIREKFNRFLYNEKKKINEGKNNAI